jgi:hypothetical protein
MPEDLGAQLEAADPRTCDELSDLAVHLNVPVAALILDALGEFPMLIAYQVGASAGRRAERARRDASDQHADQVEAGTCGHGPGCPF